LRIADILRSFAYDAARWRRRERRKRRRVSKEEGRGGGRFVWGV
jgi:hypothetical protein